MVSGRLTHAILQLLDRIPIAANPPEPLAKLTAPVFVAKKTLASICADAAM
jgi:hypothetical protein